MRLNAPACRSLLRSTLISKIIFCTLALADIVIVDDQENNPDVHWEGPWRQFWRPLAMDSTLTLGNQSDEMVTFTFIGTSVQVVGALAATATQNGVGSIYTLDNEGPVEFIPPYEVDDDAYGIKFYDSGPLELGSHRLKIENWGMQLWLDYFQFDDGDGPDTVTVGSTSTIPTTIPPSSSITIIMPSRSSSGSHDGGGIPTFSESTSSLRLSMTISALTSTSLVSSTVDVPFASSSTVTLSLPQSSSSTSSPDQSVYTPSQGVGAPQAAAHSQGMPHSVLVGLTVAAVIGVVLLALLFQLRRACLHDRQMRTALLHMPIASAPPQSDEDYAPPTVPDVERAPSAAAWARDVVHSCSDLLNDAVTRSRDGGVRVAGGLGVSNAEAPSIWSGESEKSILPPPYEEHLAP
ncbi:hypothetical protein GSI_08486 [Ganoderma sinense ZZ0214-1]|uniref:Transporter n=1 Tax=Ganoderma sinense ZZ0214-1 TaxID=1077348 RepID=A0A2G8S3V7_9APHY|nr:hypothetical protein GSI_08486 [Ganoderma sinense ZZ0214-1]